MIYTYTPYDMMRDGGTGDIRTVYVAFLLAAFILVLACANFVNLTTARSISRASEVGMRKVLGGTRAHAILQFIGESLLLTLFALGLSIVLLQALLPAINDLFNQNIILELTTDTMLMLAGVVLLAGILAGTYPAFVISSFQPTAVLRGSSVSGPAGALFRRILIVFQFTISVVLIIGTWTISDQLDYMLSEDLGLRKMASSSSICRSAPMKYSETTRSDIPISWRWDGRQRCLENRMLPVEYGRKAFRWTSKRSFRFSALIMSFPMYWGLR